MSIYQRKQQSVANQDLNERLAAVIAGKVVQYQYLIATAMSKWFNAYSVSQKKWFVISAGSLVAAILIAGFCTSFYSIPLQPISNYSSAHIGMPSEIPNQKIITNPLTDSLIIKK